jgi:hypothetical protein
MVQQAAIVALRDGEPFINELRQHYAERRMQVKATLEALPGVTHAGGTDNLPLADGFGCSGVYTDAVGAETSNCMPMVRVTPGYFETMGIKLHGVAPTWTNVELGEGPLVVSQAFAKRFWADENPISHGVKPFNSRMPPFRVVAVAEDIRGEGLQQPPVEAVYFPMISPTNDQTAKFGADWWVEQQMSLVVRAQRKCDRARQLDPEIVAQIVRRSRSPTSSPGTCRREIDGADVVHDAVLLIAATIALVLSAVGSTASLVRRPTPRRDRHPHGARGGDRGIAAGRQPIDDACRSRRRCRPGGSARWNAAPSIAVVRDKPN